jgi:GTP-binding protein YchF
LGNQFLGYIRTVDAIIVVSRCFSEPDVAHVAGDVDPIRDLETLDLELALADLETVERRLEKVAGAAKASPREYGAELQTLEDLYRRLQMGDRASRWVGDSGMRSDLARSLSLLTAKRRVYVANVDEDELPSGGPRAEDVAGVADTEGAPLVVLCAQLEAELLELDDEDARLYREETGSEHSGLEMLARAGYETLDLITFFTIVGGREVRAWPLRGGSLAPQAAGTVHTQMEHGFIRALVISFDELADAGSWQEARDRGLVRTEGRDYAIQDGDVCQFRFSP